MSFDFQNTPIVNNYGMPYSPNGNMAMSYNGINNQQIQSMVNQQQDAMKMQQAYQQKMAELETPAITVGNTGHKIGFSIVGNDGSKGTVIPVDKSLPVEVEGKKRPGRPKKEVSDSTSIIRADVPEKLTGTVEDMPSSYNYMETTGMLRETIGQIDSLNSELMQEFEMVRHSRTMKNKHNVLVGLSANVGNLLANRIQVIKEINSSINKGLDLDYKKAKDMKNAMAAQDDDKYIADLYQSFMQNPVNMAPAPQLPQVDASLFGSGIVRADFVANNSNVNGPVDTGYLNYLSNLTPEQNMMRYESNPNVKQVVVFDESTGNKFFQVMDVSTGQVIPNVPVYDQMFMEDTTLDIKNGIAKNINLNETFPIVVINQGVASQY